MVFSLLAYFFSMVTAFAIVIAALIGFGDSQLRLSPMHYSAVSVMNADRDAFAESEKAKEAQRAEEARKAAEAAEARENAKKLARAKLLRERKQAMLARLRQQQSEQSSLAFGYAEPFSSDGAGLYSFAPRYNR
jgi:hypothetical protein